MMAAQGGGGDISDYVQDGLVLLLDGKNKGSDPTAWTDLVNGYVFTNHGATFNSDHVSFASGNGEIVNIWEGGAMECHRKLGYNQSCIWACCNGRHPHHKGFKWSYNLL